MSSPLMQEVVQQKSVKMEYLAKPFQMMDKLEAQFDEKSAIPWMASVWHWSFYFSALYLALIYFGQRYMKNRKPYNLRRALCMWSALLGFFSLFAVYRILPTARRMVYLSGWRHAVCDQRSYVGSAGSGLWAFLFPLSKLPELFDTVFIVLRKQKLSFLHYYHHVTVFIYCWYSYAYPVGPGIWFGIVNYCVHAIMYCYYAVKASGRSPPRWVAKTITTIQLSQMFAGIFLNYLSIEALMNNKTCKTNWFAIAISIFFYASYAILFANFFYWAYIHKKPQSQSQTDKKVVGNGVSPVNSTANGVANGAIPTSLADGSMQNGIRRRRD